MSELGLSLEIHHHDRQDLIGERLKTLPGYVGFVMPMHRSWRVCHCMGAEHIRSQVNEEIMNDDDSPNNVLTPEEHIMLFNRVKLLSSKSSTEEIIAKRELMKRAVAIIRTHIQSHTVDLNERRTKATKAEKEAIIAADKQYVPRLRVEEKAKPARVRAMQEINADLRVLAMLKLLPTPQYNAMVSMVELLGIVEAKKLWGMDDDSTPVRVVQPNPKPKTGENEVLDLAPDEPYEEQ